MTLLRDNANDFAGAVDNAARELRLAAEFVEKNYWVTQVLRALHTHYGGWFVFKGGTSLSKGYNLIERFSEDVDILVNPAKDDSARSREHLLLAMTGRVATELGVESIAARDPGRGKFAHRADVLVYPRLPRRRTVVMPIEDRGVLLETGFAGGNWPTEMVEITPILCRPLGIDPAEFEDTATFSIPALKPARTLLEKLSLLHHVAQAHERGETPDVRCGRHYSTVSSTTHRHGKSSTTARSSAGSCPRWSRSPPSTSAPGNLVQAAATDRVPHLSRPTGRNSSAGW